MPLGSPERLPSAGNRVCLLGSLLDLPRGGLHVAVIRKLNVLVTRALIVQKQAFPVQEIPKLPHPHYSTTSVAQLKAHKHPLASRRPSLPLSLGGWSKCKLLSSQTQAALPGSSSPLRMLPPPNHLLGALETGLSRLVPVGQARSYAVQSNASFGA